MCGFVSVGVLLCVFPHTYLWEKFPLLCFMCIQTGIWRYAPNFLKSSLSKSLQRFAECQRFPPFFSPGQFWRGMAMEKKRQTTISEQKVSFKGPGWRWTFRCISNGTHLQCAVHLFLSRWKLTGSILIIEALMIIHSFIHSLICLFVLPPVYSFTHSHYK